MTETPPPRPGTNKNRATEAVADMIAASGRQHSPEQAAMLQKAVETDMDTADKATAEASTQAAVDHERLAKVEEQLDVLSHAVIVIAEPCETIDAAVQAVKDQQPK